MESTRVRILEKCRTFRARPVRGGVKLSGDEALYLEGLLRRALTADERDELRERVSDAQRARYLDHKSAERSLNRSIEDACRRAAA